MENDCQFVSNPQKIQTNRRNAEGGHWICRKAIKAEQRPEEDKKIVNKINKRVKISSEISPRPFKGNERTVSEINERAFEQIAAQHIMQSDQIEGYISKRNWEQEVAVKLWKRELKVSFDWNSPEIQQGHALEWWWRWWMTIKNLHVFNILYLI